MEGDVSFTNETLCLPQLSTVNIAAGIDYTVSNLLYFVSLVILTEFIIVQNIDLSVIWRARVCSLLLILVFRYQIVRIHLVLRKLNQLNICTHKE